MRRCLKSSALKSFWCALPIALAVGASPPAGAETTGSYLAGLHRHELLGSMIPANGDQNPYAIFVAPVSSGAIKAGDVLVDNFNARSNDQGTGTTIMDYNPATKQASLFASIPAKLDGCPGGVGLSTAMAMLKSGWIIVGSAPSTDGTTKTLGQGCLIVLDSNGKVAGTITGPEIRDPWGNMAVIENGDAASLFVSNVGFGIGAPGQAPVRQATVLRLDLKIPDGKPPVVTRRTVIGSGFAAQPDASVFLIGPTGLALSGDGTLYVSDAIGNRVVAIGEAATRTDSAGTGREVSAGGMLKRPLAMAFAPNGDLLVINALNGQVVEMDPKSGTQRGAQWIDSDAAQNPPGSGDLFGIAMAPDGKGFYYVEDDANTLMLAE
ncbi:MAG TPA: hypothetical protein VL356_04215 [Acidocella sp.]|jgi:hypothetical protein|nr:hypothetical protein [Acidocella sp.]